MKLPDPENPNERVPRRKEILFLLAEDSERAVLGEIRLHHLYGPPQPYVLARWHKEVGEAIGEREVIATVETDTFTLELEAYDAGIFAERCFAIGDEIPDGSLVARIALS